MTKSMNDSLLTDNGSSQFNRRNSIMKKYCDQYNRETYLDIDYTSLHANHEYSNAQRERED